MNDKVSDAQKVGLAIVAIIALIAVIVALCSGCGEIRMPPDYRQQLEADARRVAELNKRCQAGDDLACREGLNVCNETLALWVDAIHGVDSKGGP